MTIHGRDVRNLTRAIEHLVKVVQHLNNTFVTIERARVESKAEYCHDCSAAVCVPGTGLYKNCPCCKVDHNREAFQRYVQGLSSR